ncbi:CBO0543 family protein [Pseudalkalibacillus decolorationis]|uniref:CBO0543 family protein n=1 Tax=Pseudalkalibacillus decolorationis TaxID=163879 RepID=UPI00214952F0|nr:CBO0543 family protein [Pseudalkalibacillus decolorationis]
MHILLSILVVIASIYLGDWKNWKRYYPTMLFIALSNLLYKLFALTYFHLWEALPNFLLLDKLSVYFLHVFIINPFSAFLFLSNYPKTKGAQVFHTAKWILIYLVLEWIAVHNGSINHYKDWNMGWSALFVIVMFLLLRIHFLYPFRALVLSLFLTLFYLIVFDYL